ncbi:hypothetical protein ACEPAF_9092 [Sanghuangporus sanghuang]
MADENEINNIHDVIKGLMGGPAGQDCLEKFKFLCQELQEFFEQYPNIEKNEEVFEIERNFILQHCIEYYLRHLDAEVLKVSLETFDVQTESDKVVVGVHPAANLLIGLLSVATEHIKLFKDDSLFARYCKFATLACGFVPSLDPQPSRPVHSANTLEFLMTINFCISDIGSGWRPTISTASSIFSEEVLTPSDETVDAGMCTIAGPSGETPGYLAEDKDVDHIISGGLGLLGGRRKHACESGSDTNSSLSDPPPAQNNEQELSPAYDSFEQRSPTDKRSEAKEQSGKRKRSTTQKKNTSKRQKNSPVQSSPNKENIHQDA